MNDNYERLQEFLKKGDNVPTSLTNYYKRSSTDLLRQGLVGSFKIEVFIAAVEEMFNRLNSMRTPGVDNNNEKERLVSILCDFLRVPNTNALIYETDKGTLRKRPIGQSVLRLLILHYIKQYPLVEFRDTLTQLRNKLIAATERDESLVEGLQQALLAIQEKSVNSTSEA